MPAGAQGAGGNPFAPYWQPPLVKGGPVPRLPDGKPDLQGYRAARFNHAIYDIEDHPVALPGIPPGRGAIVYPPGGKIPYKPEAAATCSNHPSHSHAAPMFAVLPCKGRPRGW